jgi:uncharacterized protein (DUF1919 family)
MRLKNKNFSIVSNNCWGGGVYQALKLPYRSPFVGLFINAPCYLKLLRDFNFYMSCGLEFTETSKYGQYNGKKYPVGILAGEVEIHFLHFKTKEEALEKWERRKMKLPNKTEDIFFKIDDRDFCTPELIAEFHSLKYPRKISFTKKKQVQEENNIPLKNPNGFILFDTTFDHLDIINWINTGNIDRTFFYKFLMKVWSYPKKFN